MSKEQMQLKKED